jgi:oxygen-independent coproporphyrinogen-3 oxidase
MTGIYISIPFCKSKCSYCNFASGVFSRDRMQKYVDRLAEDIANTEAIAASLGADYSGEVDSIYLGGGTPSTLEPTQLREVFAAARTRFHVVPDAEVTVECAPGTLSAEVIQTLLACGVNRVSLGVQSFVDQEAKSVARLHDAATTHADIANLRAAGISNINVDLIAGLPHQTRESWQRSVDAAIATGAPHVSIYMLEVDEDSRLGREVMAGGQKYHAHHVPDDELTVELYETARKQLNAAGIAQYEISNFAREGSESKHNLKYWTRRPYIGFGLDAHSMLPLRSESEHAVAVRFSTIDDLDEFLKSAQHSSQFVSPEQELEERFFLGLRLNEGISTQLTRNMPESRAVVDELLSEGLLVSRDGRISLSDRGRLLSNEVFERFVAEPAVKISVH